MRNKTELRNMLMNRDHCTKQEANLRINVTQQLINEVCEDEGTLDDVEDILLQHLGIELDYIHLFI